MAHSSSKPASICGTTCRSIFVRMKSSCSCRAPGSLVSNRIRWMAWHSEKDCGTAFQEKTCKANYRSCLNLHGKKQLKATCRPKPSARCSGKSRNAYTRRNHYALSLETKRKVDSEQLSIRITLRLANALQESTSSGWFASSARGSAGCLVYSFHG